MSLKGPADSPPKSEIPPIPSLKFICWLLMEAKRIRTAVCHFSISGMRRSDVGPHTMAALFCRRGIPRGSWPDHYPYLLAGIPREPHHFSRHVWAYRWHWGTLKQVCKGRKVEPGDFPTFCLPPHSMISHHASFTHRGMWSQFLWSPLRSSWSEKWGSGVSTQTCSSDVWRLASIHKAISLSW